MKKSLPIILLTITCAALAVALYSAKQESAGLKAERATLEEDAAKKPAARADVHVKSEDQPGTVANLKQSVPDEGVPEDGPSADSKAQENERRRVMGNMAKMMMENPTMNKVMEASQRGAVGALYADLIEYLGLDAEETGYFMDLLMHRQMKHVESAMKLMAGGLSEEERLALMEEMKAAGTAVESEMESFLNNASDFEEFKFYEKTMGERMMLSQVDAKLAGTDQAFSDETYREVLEIMYEERENFTFSTDLGDQENMDLSAERFSQENIDLYMQETLELGENIDARLEQTLTPEQLAAYHESGKAMLDMHFAQLQQARQMFGNGE